MALNTNTQDQNLEVTQNIEGNEGGNTQVTTEPTAPTVDNNKGNEKTYSQKELDDNAANTRRVTERETKKKLLAQLGLTLDDEEKLSKFKKAYEDSLTDEEKKQTELDNLQAEKLKLTQDLEEKDYVIKALIEMTGKKEEDVEKIVKMAKGLKTDENTIEDAVREVIKMINPESVTTNITGEPNNNNQNPNMPKGQQIAQPSTVIIDTQDNPFKPGQINLTKQGKLFRENPELARKLAKEAGVELKF